MFLSVNMLFRGRGVGAVFADCKLFIFILYIAFDFYFVVGRA